MKFSYVLSLMALLNASVEASNLRSNRSSAKDDLTPEERRLAGNWERCPPEDGPWIFAPREECVDGKKACKPGWKEGDVQYCGVAINECTETGVSPCGTAKCVDLDPFNGQYKCVCSDSVTGFSDLGFGPTACSDPNSCGATPSLCDSANGGFCTTDDNGGSYYCTCPSTHTDVNGDGSNCQLISGGSTGGSTGGTTGASCATLTCPTGQTCGTTSTGSAVCVDCPSCTGSTGGGVELISNPDDENFCKLEQNKDACCAKFNCDDNNFCGLGPRGFNCLCNPGWWQVHPGGFCRREMSNCVNCAANAQCNNNICSCNDGYSGDGSSCPDTDECSEPTLNTCASFQDCVNTDGSFECVNKITLAPSPGPTAGPTVAQTPGPTNSPVASGVIKLTMMADSNAVADTSVQIYNTFDNTDVVLSKDDFVASVSNTVTGTTATSTGCYTVVVYDTGTGVAEGLLNSVATTLKVEIGSTVLLNVVLAAAGTQTNFAYKSFRIGTGCSCASSEAAYDFKQYHATVDTKLAATVKGVTPVASVIEYTSIPANTFVDTRVCTTACLEVAVTGSPTLFEITKLNGNNKDVDTNDFKIVQGAPTVGDTTTTYFDLGSGCCTGQVLLLQSFYDEAGSSSIVRTLNTDDSTITTLAGYSLTSECINDPSAACLKFDIPNVEDLAYAINVDDTTKAGAITATSGAETVEFGSTCTAGNLLLSVTPPSTGTTRMYLSDIVDFTASTVSKASLVVLDDEDVATATSLSASISPSGCYSFLVFNSEGDQGNTPHSVQFPIGTTVFSSNTFPFPKFSTNPTYDTYRIGSGCGCAAGLVAMDIQYLAISGSVEITGSVTKTLTASDEYVLDTRTCVDSGSALSIPFTSGDSTSTFASISMDGMEIVRIDSAESTYTPFSCGAEEIQLTLSTTSGPWVQVKKKTVGDDIASEDFLISDSSIEGCVPKAGCTRLTLSGETTFGSGQSFILAKNYAEVLASGTALPTSPIDVGDSCATMDIAVAGYQSATVYVYDSKTAISDENMILERVVSDTATSVSYDGIPYDSSKCYTVAVVKPDATEAPTISVIANGAPVTADGSSDTTTNKYFFYKVGSCDCASGEVPIDVVWFTPDADTSVVTRFGIRNKVEETSATIRNDFLYSFRYCETATERANTCLGTILTRSGGGLGTNTVTPEHFVKSFYNNKLVSRGIYNRDTTVSFSPGCCPAANENVAVVSYYIDRVGGTNNNLLQDTTFAASESKAATNDVARGEGAGEADEYCFGIPDASTGQCATVTLKSNTGNFNFGPNGFVDVVFPSAGTGTDDLSLAGGDDLVDDIVIGLGSSDCVVPTVGF